MTLDDQHNEVRGGKGGGASIQMFDPRVSRGLAWLFGLLGTLAVAVLCWVAMSINQLNVNVAKVVTRLDAKEATDNAQDVRITRTEDRIEDLTGDVRTLEGRNLRGGSSGH